MIHSSDPQDVWSCFVLHPTENNVLERKAQEMEWKVKEEKFCAYFLNAFSLEHYFHFGRTYREKLMPWLWTQFV